MSFCESVDAEQSRLPSQRRKCLLQPCHSRDSDVEPSWTRLGHLQGSTGCIFIPGGFTWRAESRLLPFLEIDLSGMFFHKVATAVLRYFFHHGRLPPQRWVQGRVRLAGMRLSSLLLGFCAGKGLLLPAAMTRGKRLTETFRLVAM